MHVRDARSSSRRPSATTARPSLGDVLFIPDLRGPPARARPARPRVSTARPRRAAPAWASARSSRAPTAGVVISALGLGSCIGLVLTDAPGRRRGHGPRDAAGLAARAPTARRASSPTPRSRPCWTRCCALGRPAGRACRRGSPAAPRCSAAAVRRRRCSTSASATPRPSATALKAAGMRVRARRHRRQRRPLDAGGRDRRRRDGARGRRGAHRALSGAARPPGRLKAPPHLTIRPAVRPAQDARVTRSGTAHTRVAPRIVRPRSRSHREGHTEAPRRGTSPGSGRPQP